MSLSAQISISTILFSVSSVDLLPFKVLIVESRGNQRNRGISAHLLHSRVEDLSHLCHSGDVVTAPGFLGSGVRSRRGDGAAEQGSSGSRVQRAALGSSRSCRPL